MFIPKVIDIENVRGFCNAACIMCPISTESVSYNAIMSLSEFKDILQALLPYRDKIMRLNLVGLGEPTLDKGISEKILLAKQYGFEIGVITNGGKPFDDGEIEGLLLADYILFSIDSFEKEIYEKIRVNLSFEKTVKNVVRTVKMRNSKRSSAHIQIRTIETKFNKNIWKKYVDFWRKNLSLIKGDLILAFPEHNWADAKYVIEKDCTCSYVYERMSISASGEVELCCVDFNEDFVEGGIGNVFIEDPIAIYNNKVFSMFRNTMDKGKINELNPCKFCNVPNMRSIRYLHEI